MPLPSRLTFNELNGEEVAHILEERFHQLLSQQPLLQRHLTLPRVRMTLAVKLEMYADQPSPDTVSIDDRLTVDSDQSENWSQAQIQAQIAESAVVIDGSPPKRGERGHQPPDQIRDEHHLAIPTPRRGDIAVEDTLDGKVTEYVPGLRIDRSGNSEIARGAVVVTQDFGPAGLASGNQRVVPDAARPKNIDRAQNPAPVQRDFAEDREKIRNRK